MKFELSDEQRMLREAARDALARVDSVAGARGALDGAPLPDVWPTAIEAGWTGLLIGEDDGGAGLGAFDAMLVMEECGKRLTGAGLLGHLLGTHLLARTADARLPALAAGELRAAFAPARPPAGDEGWTVEATGGASRRGAPPELAGGRVTGTIAFVPDLAGADLVVAVALDAGSPRAVLLEGIEAEPLVRYDATRLLAHLVLDGA